MKVSINNYLCDSCKHREVCVNKGVYQAFQDAVNNIKISVPHTDRVSKIIDFEWLSPTKLECKNFLY